ncbi:MAG: YdcF family protein [Pirellulales bacterium]
MKMFRPKEKDLFLSDVEGRTDAAIVFGSSHPTELEQRIRHGCYLFFEGITSRLVLTGDGRHKNRFRQSEAERMAEIAVSLGVPRKQIVVEDRSNTTVENIRNCCEIVCKRSILEPEFVGLVSSAWHMYRVLMIAEHFLFPSAIFRCLPTQEGWNAENWSESSEGKRLVANELTLIDKLLAQGVQVPTRIWSFERNARMRERPE